MISGLPPYSELYEEPNSSLTKHDASEQFVLPSPDNEKVLEKTNGVSSLEKIENLEKRGNQLPSRLAKCLAWFKKAFEILEKSSTFLAKAVGFTMKYLGLVFLLVGAVHVFVVIFTTPLSTVLATGLVTLVLALVTRGAIPVMLAGGSLFFFGSSLLKGETPGLHNFLNGFPIISYFMNLIPSNYHPADLHQQV